MRLSSGSSLGAYEIVSLLGAGGMGEVYRARDARLGRIVAIKVLPESVASDPGACERLAREARAISALTHPNICTLFDIGHQDGIDYLVMEYVEGDTLASRLKAGPVPLEEAVRIGTEIAQALGDHDDGTDPDRSAVAPEPGGRWKERAR